MIQERITEKVRALEKACIHPTIIIVGENVQKEINDMLFVVNYGESRQNNSVGVSSITSGGTMLSLLINPNDPDFCEVYGSELVSMNIWPNETEEA